MKNMIGDDVETIHACFIPNLGVKRLAEHISGDYLNEVIERAGFEQVVGRHKVPPTMSIIRRLIFKMSRF
jgi:hypothetical protein